jgi:hypothetical protein
MLQTIIVARRPNRFEFYEIGITSISGSPDGAVSAKQRRRPFKIKST